MKIQFSDKAEKLEAGIFAVLNEKKEQLAKQGREIYNLSVGTPDFRTPQHIIDAVSEAAKKPEKQQPKESGRRFSSLIHKPMG